MAKQNEQMDDFGMETTGSAAVLSASWMDALQVQFGSVPWWLMSTMAHVIVIALMSLFVVSEPPLEKTEIFFPDINHDKEVPETPEENSKDEFVTENAPEVQMENVAEQPFIPHEKVELADHVETDCNMDDDSARGQDDAVSEIPCGDIGVIATLGIGSGVPSGAFGTRLGGGRGNKGRPSGRGRKPEDDIVIRRALRWLARNQEEDGSWAVSKWGGNHTEGARVGLTGLCLLAFLGDGHTEKVGEFKVAVRKAVKYLKNAQAEDGCIGKNNSQHSSHSGEGYNHAIAGLALVEAYGMAEVRSTKIAAQKAVDYTLKSQKEYSGWRYGPNTPADLSVTGWYVMQLKSAKIVQLKVSANGFRGAVRFLDTVTEKPNEQSNDYYGGRCKYMDGRNYNAVMTSVGMVCRQFMGWKRTDPILMGGQRELLKNLPVWDGNGAWTYYYWYYGSLAMFQMKGHGWKKWNVAMRKAILDNQIISKDPKLDGSWEPVKDGAKAGRAYSTAMGALCMEVYYRYELLQ